VARALAFHSWNNDMKSKTLSCISTTLVLLSLIPSNANSVGSQQRDYTFKRSISRLVLETKLWFFYAAASYMDINIEAIHLGQS